MGMESVVCEHCRGCGASEIPHERAMSAPRHCAPQRLATNEIVRPAMSAHRYHQIVSSSTSRSMSRSSSRELLQHNHETEHADAEQTDVRSELSMSEFLTDMKRMTVTAIDGQNADSVKIETKRRPRKGGRKSLRAKVEDMKKGMGPSSQSVQYELLKERISVYEDRLRCIDPKLVEQ